MAVIAKQRYKLDIAPKGGWVIVYVSQHDDAAREIEFEITNQGNAYSIPASINISVQGVKSNKGYFSHSCSYSGNIVTMTLANDMTDVIGKAICVLKFTNSSQQKLATAKFILNVDSDSSSEGVIIDTEAEEIFNQMLDEIRAQAASVSADIAELQSMVGSPLVASTVSAMTDHNKIYVYTGSESGYTNGNWYYWDGSAWTSGGVYNSVAVNIDSVPTAGSTNAVQSGGVKSALDVLQAEIPTIDSIPIQGSGNAVSSGGVYIELHNTDTTLTQSGQPADAKKTGDEIGDLKDGLTDLKSAFDAIATTGGTSAQMVDSSKYVNGYRWDNTLDSDIDANPVAENGWTIINQQFFVDAGTTIGISTNSEIVVLGYAYNPNTEKYTRSAFIQGSSFVVSGDHFAYTFANNIRAFKVYISTAALSHLTIPLIIAINSEWDGNPNYGQVSGAKINPNVEIPQINALKNEVESDIQDLQKLNLGTLVDGFVNSQYGSFVEANTYKRTGYLPISGKTINVMVTASVANVGMAFYGGSKAFISGVDFSGYTLGATITVNVPQSARYVAYCAINAESGNMMITFPNYADSISNLVEAISEESTAKTDSAIKTISNLSLGTLEDGYINSASGAAMSATSYKRTGFIHVQADKIKVAITFSVASVGFAFYDSRKKYISGFDYTGYNVGDLKEVDVPDNACYFRYCAVNANVSLMQVLIPNYANAVSRIDTNPCFYDGSSECRTFKKILCIGDSLTAGQFDYKENGVTKEFNAPEYSYPSYLKAITGRDTTNAGDAGETTVSWYELHGQEDFSGHDACIIMLGRNDYVSGRETTSEERATAFANIVAKVRADNPQITIFMATLINYYKGSGADAMNQDIRTAATANNCYLLDIAAYGRMVLSDDAYSHCTAEGYYTLAEYFFRYISYIMHNNYTAFKTIQFTGTNRAF